MYLEPRISYENESYNMDLEAPNPTKAYGLRTESTFGPYELANSLESSSRYENASLRGYDFSAMVRYTTLSAMR